MRAGAPPQIQYIGKPSITCNPCIANRSQALHPRSSFLVPRSSFLVPRSSPFDPSRRDKAFARSGALGMDRRRCAKAGGRSVVRRRQMEALPGRVGSPDSRLCGLARERQFASCVPLAGNGRDRRRVVREGGARSCTRRGLQCTRSGVGRRWRGSGEQRHHSGAPTLSPACASRAWTGRRPRFHIDDGSRDSTPGTAEESSPPHADR
jgi:hypothetical protein